MTTDKELIRQRFEASFLEYDRQAGVQQEICSRLASHVAALCRKPVVRAFEIGIGTGFLTSRLLDIYPGAEWFLNDLTPVAEKFVAKYAAGTRHEYLWGDAEALEYPEGLDLIASASTVQWFADKVRFVRKSAAALNRGGYIALSTFGPEHFHEIKSTTGEGLDYPDEEELNSIFSAAGYKVLGFEDYRRVLDFDTPSDVLHHIRTLGVNAVRKIGWTPGRKEDFEKRYAERFSTGNGRVTLTYHPVLIMAEKM